MPAHDELRTTTLWCADCDHVFGGKAWYTVHTVDDRPEPVAVVFARAASPCPNNPNHARVGDVAERPGG